MELDHFNVYEVPALTERLLLQVLVQHISEDVCGLLDLLLLHGVAAPPYLEETDDR